QHVAAHLQELRLPVLEQRLGEVTRAEVVPERRGRLTRLYEFLVTHLPPEHGLQQREDDERREHHQREPVQPHPPPHRPCPGSQHRHPPTEIVSRSDRAANRLRGRRRRAGATPPLRS